MSAVPFIKFFPSDWLSDERLRLVSVGARGLWIDLICLMAKNEKRGYLTLNGGVNPTLAQVGKLVCLSECEIAPLLDELKQAGVCSIEAQTGVIFSRRIVRDTEYYNQSVTHGKKGGNPTLKNRVKGTVNTPVNPSVQPSLGSGFCDSIHSSESEGCVEETTKIEDQIYDAYPRKEGRQAALKAIRSILKHRPEWRDRLLTKVHEYASAVSLWSPEDRQYVPHASTWFNRGSYEDDPAVWRRGEQAEILTLESVEAMNRRREG